MIDVRDNSTDEMFPSQLHGIFPSPLLAFLSLSTACPREPACSQAR